MKGEVIIPFVAQWEGRTFCPAQGDIIEIPPNVDWVRAGFVVELEDESDETPAPKPKAKAKKVKDVS